MKWTQGYSRFAGAAIALAFLAGCTTDSNSASEASDNTISREPRDTKNEGDTGTANDGPSVVLLNATSPSPRLFDVKLSQGEALAIPETANTVTPGEALSDRRRDELLSALPSWDDPSSLSAPFAWPTQSPPPPRVGLTTNQPFPPKTSSEQPAVNNGPLKVLRVQPEGNVPIAPYLAVTFNQPMVAVGTATQVTPSTAPVKLEPAIAGRWQWIGTRTLRFDADNDAVDRLPMATMFTATVPAGTRSEGGETLATAATFTFTTPPPTVTTFFPQQENVELQPVFVATFDQRITPSALLASIKLRAGDDIPVRLASKSEIDSDEAAKNLVANAHAERWIAFRPTRPLPTDTPFTIDMGPNIPSAEGPLTTAAAQSFTARTYGPLKVKQARCAYVEQCAPGNDLLVEFTNPLDAKAPGTTDANIVVSPSLPAKRVTINQQIFIEGATQARTTYAITLPSSLSDIFGQKLGSEQTVSVTIGSARPSLGQLQPIITLDPYAKTQKLSLLSTNRDTLRVRVFKVGPADFLTYTRYLESRYDRVTALPKWTVLSDTQLSPKGAKDATVETEIDLGKELRRRPGQVIVYVEPVPTVSPDSEDSYQNQPTIAWVQSSTMTLDSFTDNDSLRAWATDLRTGTPIKGVSVTPLTDRRKDGASITTNDDGLAVVPMQSNSQILYLTGTRGDDTFILPVNESAEPNVDSLRWYTFDDRQIYRPGETLRLKGWVRQLSAKAGALSVFPVKTADYVVQDSFGVELTKGTVALGPLGGFDLKVDIPSTANTGGANISFSANSAPPSNGNHSFQIAEFRRPEFEVKVEPTSTSPFMSTGPVTMSAQASYYAGGPLPNAPVAWTVSTSETTFSPAGWDGFTFGIFRPWWWSDDFFSRRSPGNNSQQTQQYSGTTDATGRHAVRLDFSTSSGKLPDLPVSVSVSGTVTDVNRQAWADQRNILVHSADRYVGLRSDRSFVRQGDSMNVEAIVADIDGKAQPGTKVTLTAGLLRFSYVEGKSVEEIVDPQTCTVTTAAQGTKCEFSTPIGGQYRISSTVTDAKGGQNRTELSVWVSGATSQPSRTVEQEELTLVPDKARYAAGDTAQLLVQAPFVKGEGLLVVTHHNGVRSTQRFFAADGSAQLEIPITEADVPSLGVTVEVVGASDRVGFDGKKIPGVPQRPAYAVGALTLSVPPLARTLRVTATPADIELLPGGKTTIAVTVKDPKGAPVKDAEFAVVVVDEAVLGLTDYKLPDPIEIFYADGYSSLSTGFGRSQVQLRDLETQPPAGGNDAAGETEAAADTVAAAAESGGSADKLAAPAPALAERSFSRTAGSESATPISVRSNFDALALFQPTVVTDASGRASIDVTLPDNLTRYRVMVVAVSGNERFGTAESNITAQLPLSVRPSAPRFLNTGDSFELPVVLQNLTKSPMAVDVVMQAANLDVTGPAGRNVTIPANDRIEIRFAAKVRSAGTARVRVSGFATSGSSTDSSELSIPVFTPGTAEAFATYGTLDKGAIRQPVLAPTDVVDSYGGLEISTSSTSLQALTDSLLYVSDYDYRSSDSYASRIIAIGALRGVLKDFSASSLPAEAELNAAVDRDIAGLRALQNDDGGWSYWRRFERSEPYNSVQATHALVLAKQAGYVVSQNMIDEALQYLVNIEQNIPADYSENSRDTVRAYALWVSSLAGQRNPNKAADLFRERGSQMNLDALAWLWGSLDDPSAKASIERTITNRSVDTAGAVSFTSGYNDGDYLTLGSDQRTDAVVLDALITNAPKSDLIDKVVAGLLAHQTKGRWGNVQENTFALLAFKRYYDTYESVSPDFVAKAWLGNQFAGERSFKGRSTDRSQISIPMKALTEGGNRDLVIAKDGAGRLYYRIGLRYVPADLTLDALDRGFVVNRIYEGVDKKSDVSRDPDGRWHIKAGAKVRVRLTLVVESQRTHVALIDPLPAGLEALNPTLAVSEPVVDSGSTTGSNKYWWGNWYDFQQFRDDRSETFTTFLPAGVYDYSYIARATTPGSFIVPPTRAEEMYAPETFGRASTDRVAVE